MITLGILIVYGACLIQQTKIIINIINNNNSNCSFPPPSPLPPSSFGSQKDDRKKNGRKKKEREIKPNTRCCNRDSCRSHGTGCGIVRAHPYPHAPPTHTHPCSHTQRPACGGWGRGQSLLGRSAMRHLKAPDRVCNFGIWIPTSRHLESADYRGGVNVRHTLLEIGFIHATCSRAESQRRDVFPTPPPPPPPIIFYPRYPHSGSLEGFLF